MSEPEAQPTASPAARVARWELVALLVLVLVGAVLRLARPELSYFNLHVGRDLYRALQLLRLDEIPLLGSEMQYGGRVFGPLIYIIYAIPLALWVSPLSVGLFIGLVNTALLAWTWYFTRLYFGAVAALAATGLYAVFPLEIVQLRFLWNPAFLPIMVLGMYHSLFRAVVDGSKWHYLGVALFFSFGFQLHFSVLLAIPVVLVGMLYFRRLPGWKVTAACAGLVLLLFLPFIVHELKPNQRAVIKDVIKTENAKADLLERHRPNPNAWRNLLYTVSFDWNEEAHNLGFTYLKNLKDHSKESLGNFWSFLLQVVRVGALFQLFLWATGIYVAAMSLVRARRGEAPFIPIAAALLLLGWQFIPVMLLTFFNFHIKMADAPSRHSLIPLRYYLVTYPAQFILAGVGLAHLVAMDGKPLRKSLFWIAPTVALLAGYVFASASHLAVLARTGKALDYLAFRVPTLGKLLEVREVLLGDYKLNIDDYYENTYTRNVFQPYMGEVSLDWLITQDPRSYRNSPMPAGRFILISAPAIGEVAKPNDIQAMLGTARALRVESVGDIRIIEIEGAVPSDDKVFDARLKRNYYYRDERMKYLGGGQP